MKFTILVDPSLFLITIYLVYLINAWKSREKDILKKKCILLVWSLPDDLYKCRVYLNPSTGMEFNWQPLQLWNLHDDLYICRSVEFTWRPL